MTRYIRTENAPTPGAYSQAVVIDPALYNLVFLAGQTANTPGVEDEPVVSGGIFQQTMQTLYNILAVVKTAGGNANHIVELKVFLKDSEGVGEERHKARIAVKEKFDRAYEYFFKTHGRTKKDGNLPARTLVWVSELPLPDEDTLVEITAVAAVPKAK